MRKLQASHKCLMLWWCSHTATMADVVNSLGQGLSTMHACTTMQVEVCSIMQTQGGD